MNFPFSAPAEWPLEWAFWQAFLQLLPLQHADLRSEHALEENLGMLQLVLSGSSDLAQSPLSITPPSVNPG